MNKPHADPSARTLVVLCLGLIAITGLVAYSGFTDTGPCRWLADLYAQQNLNLHPLVVSFGLWVVLAGPWVVLVAVWPGLWADIREKLGGLTEWLRIMFTPPWADIREKLREMPVVDRAKVDIGKVRQKKKGVRVAASLLREYRLDRLASLIHGYRSDTSDMIDSRCNREWQEWTKKNTTIFRRTFIVSLCALSWVEIRVVRIAPDTFLACKVRRDEYEEDTVSAL
jgi:hypothetical protein